MAWNYATLVEERSTRNPSLQSLHHFLSTPQPSSSIPERIVSIDIFPASGKGSGTSQSVQLHRDVSPSRLANELRDDVLPLGHGANDGKMPLGQILIIENISHEAICLLGAHLNIDPMFFAAHLHSPYREVKSQSPKFYELPSQTRQQESFATFTYHQALTFPELEEQDHKLFPSASNIPRKVVVFPGEEGRRVGLAQHCCSILVSSLDRKTRGWLGLVLVDPPVGATFVSFRSDQQAVVIRTPSKPLFGRTEDFIRTTTDNEKEELTHANTALSSGQQRSATQSMLNDLLGSWHKSFPEDLNPQTPLTVRALSYYPLRLIASEWVSYLALMCLCLRQYDSPPSSPGGKSTTTVSAAAAASMGQDLERINSALVSISSWPRRVISSTTSLQKCTNFIKHHSVAGGHTTSTGPSPSPSQWQALQDDYDHLTQSLIQQGKQLEAAVPLVAAYLQLAESRRANLETKDVSRLTVLAFVFVPLSFVSGLFSMNPDISPGGSRFWLYFVVALPMVVLVLFVARPVTWNRLVTLARRGLEYLSRCTSGGR